MLDLKPYHDAVIMTDAEVKRVANEIDALFREGTDEAKQNALALQESLDTAQGKYDAAIRLYESLKKANSTSNTAQRFVPVSETPAAPEEETPKGVMKLSEFQNLSPRERLAFAKAGGRLED